jgi:hypothetical protein
MGEEGCDFLLGVAFVVKQNVAADPLHVGFFYAVGVLLKTNCVSNLV